MKTNLTYKISSALLVLLFINGCSTLHSDRDKAADYKIERSILKNDTVNDQSRGTSESVLGGDNVSTELNLEDKRVEPFKRLQNGPGELTDAPIFADDSLVSFAAERVGVAQFAQSIFGELLNLNFSLGAGADNSDAQLSISITRPVTKVRMYNVAKNLLASKGFQVYQKDGLVFILKPPKGGNSLSAIGIGSSAGDIPNASGKILQIIPYVFNSANTISKAILAMSSVEISTDAQQKLLFVQGQRFEIARVLRIVNMLDVPALTGRVIDVLRLQEVSPKHFVERVTDLLQQEGIQAGPSKDISFVTLPRMNSVIVFSSNQDFTNRVKFWMQELDVEIGGDQKRFYIYRPKYSRAADIAISISPFLGALTASGGAAAEDGEDDKTTVNGPTMSLDENQNALIFYEVPQKYEQLQQLLDRLDVLPGQVALDVAIAEITLTDEVSSGIDWLYNSQQNASGSAVLDLNSSAGSFALTAFDGDWKVALNLLDSVTDSRLISKPYLVVRDGQTATINSGNQIPTVSQSTVSIDNPDVGNTVVQYRTTGVTLTVTPTINAEGIVLLQISQEVSQSVPTEGFEVATPTISSRSINTEIYAGDGKTVILGGLIQDDTSFTDNGVPLLAELPLLGNFFKTQGDSATRTELIVMITAKIIRNMSDLDEIAEELKKLYSFPIDT